MKKKNITAIVKELNVRMKKEPITLRYIHILVSVVFFSSAASPLPPRSLLQPTIPNITIPRQRSILQPSHFSSSSSSSSSQSSGNEVADEELMQRAKMASRGV
ncbi:unnamed protein product, partial [Brassica oleracea]